MTRTRFTAPAFREYVVGLIVILAAAGVVLVRGGGPEPVAAFPASPTLGPPEALAPADVGAPSPAGDESAAEDSR